LVAFSLIPSQTHPKLKGFYKAKTFQNQTAKPKRLNEKLWHEMLRGKTLNQSRVLQHKQLRSPHLRLMPRPIRWRGRMRKIPCRRSGCRNCRCWRQIK